jgi:hypothetical protein
LGFIALALNKSALGLLVEILGAAMFEAEFADSAYPVVTGLGFRHKY